MTQKASENNANDDNAYKEFAYASVARNVIVHVKKQKMNSYKIKVTTQLSLTIQWNTDNYKHS